MIIKIYDIKILTKKITVKQMKYLETIALGYISGITTRKQISSLTYVEQVKNIEGGNKYEW